MKLNNNTLDKLIMEVLNESGYTRPVTKDEVKSMGKVLKVLKKTWSSLDDLIQNPVVIGDKAQALIDSLVDEEPPSNGALEKLNAYYQIYKNLFHWELFGSKSDFGRYNFLTYFI